MLTRRAFLALMGNLSITSSLAYAHWLEPREIQLSRIRLRGPAQQTRSWRVAHISDLHYESETSLEVIKQTLPLLQQANPQLIFITGDFITDRISSYETYLKVLKEFSAIAPTFASLGNHDGGKWSGSKGLGYGDTFLIRKLLKEANIHCLYNEAFEHQSENQTISIVGLADTWAGEMDPAAAFKQAKDHSPGLRVLLSHNPDTKEHVLPYSWDLMLCGHTHGGQVVLPIINYAPVVPVKDKRFVSGLKVWKNRYIHISRGVGSIGGLRFNCPPEVTILDVVN